MPNLTKPYSFAILLVQALLTGLSAAVILRLWRANLIVPFNYWGDTVFELTLVKSIADGGWIWAIERLGAPFGLTIVAFPQNLTLSSIAMKAIAVFTPEPGLILNIFWLVTIAATSVVCHVGLRSLSISRASSLVLSTLYALLPYALYRNTAHISLTYIFVPIVAAYAVEILASAKLPKKPAHEGVWLSRMLVFVCAVSIGFDYIYNSFFACFFLVFAGAAGALHGRQWFPLQQALAVVALISFCAALNFSPSFFSWKKHGVPPNMEYKSIAEAEVYGLKIRHVMSPLTSISLKGKDSPTQAANFPLENENQFAKLGVVGAVGFLLALVHGLFGTRQPKGVLSWSAGVLTIVGTLLATIGGFGAIFNLLITPDIRAYNRIIVFLAFFAFVILGLQLDIARLKISALLTRWNKRTWERPIVATLAFCILFVGLFDQGKAAAPLVARYASDELQANEEREMVQRIERTLPQIRRVYQLPETVFPPDGGSEKMLTYDHGRPYLWSQQLSWSWPSFSDKRQIWASSIGKPLEDVFLTNLVTSGFDGLWLDRFGYNPADLLGVEAKLTGELGMPAAVSSTGRYVMFSMQTRRAQWLATKSASSRALAQQTLLEPIQLSFKRGFYGEEVSTDGRTRQRWSRLSSVANIENPSTYVRNVEFRAQLIGNPGGVLTIKAGSHTATLPLTNGANEIVLPIELAPESRSRIEFFFTGSKIHAPGDPRSMHFAVVNAFAKEIK